MADIFIKRGNVTIDMHMGKTSYEDRGRDQGDVSKSQRMPNVARTSPAAR